jgi:hypothetical protein
MLFLRRFLLFLAICAFVDTEMPGALHGQTGNTPGICCR